MTGKGFFFLSQKWAAQIKTIFWRENYDLAHVSVSVKAGKSISATKPQHFWPWLLMMQDIQSSCNDYATCTKTATFSKCHCFPLAGCVIVFIHSSGVTQQWFFIFFLTKIKNNKYWKANTSSVWFNLNCCFAFFSTVHTLKPYSYVVEDTALT